MIHSNRPLVFAPMICLFLLCILIRIVYSEENTRYHQPPNDKPIYAMKTDFVSQVYIMESRQFTDKTVHRQDF